MCGYRHHNNVGWERFSTGCYLTMSGPLGLLLSPLVTMERTTVLNFWLGQFSGESAGKQVLKRQRPTLSEWNDSHSSCGWDIAKKGTPWILCTSFSVAQHLQWKLRLPTQPQSKYNNSMKQNLRRDRSTDGIAVPLPAAFRRQESFTWLIHRHF